MFFLEYFTFYSCFFTLIVSSFSPDTSPFDAYGLKLAANDILLVESLSSDSSFFMRLAPFNYSLSCNIAYNDSDQYVYAVALDSQATYNDTIRFVFIGVNKITDVPFIGSLTYTGVMGPNFVKTGNLSRKVVFPCSGWQTSNYRIHQFSQFASDSIYDSINNDFFVVTVAPGGKFAYAFTQSFLLVYNLDQDTVSNQLGNITWHDTSFLPYAVDVSQDLFFVVLGYIGDSNSKYTPRAYLLNISSSTFYVVDTWFYTPPTSSSWQASLTNWDANVYAAKYAMSVRMNPTGDQVLLGIQIMNTIILLDVEQTNQTFGKSVQSLSNGKAIGMGKAVGWFDTDIILVLVNTYSLNYIWSSSQVNAYNVTGNNSFSVTSIFPNIQQTLAPTFGPSLLSLVVTPNHTAVLLDSQGDYYILLPSPAGAFSDTSSGTTSSSLLCVAGTYTVGLDIFSCSLCPPNTTTNGLIGQASCKPCSNNTFCPLGAAFGDIGMSSFVLTDVNQIRAYPVSPQSVRFDNILVQNMFTINTAASPRCLLVSPLFWAIIVIAVGLCIRIIMFIINRYVSHPVGKKTEQKIKRFLKKTDLIGEGELVIGGLFSFAIFVLVIFAYTFSSFYFYRYPIEQVHGDADFACDQTLTNAQFSSGLMAIGIPPNDDVAPLFALLDDQLFTLYVDFINTVFNCTDITVTQIKDISIPMTFSSCNDTSSTISLSLLLPSHAISLQIALAGINTIGGFRVGLQGPGVETKDKTLNADFNLLELVFAQSLSVSGRVLTQKPLCTLQLTKVINRTYPLFDNDETQFSGIWLSTFSGSLDQMFVDESEYMYGTSSTTVLSIVISETSFYTLNTQRPITSEDELIFSDLLFTIVCLEIFGLGFLIFKLIIVPSFKWILSYCRRRTFRQDSIMSNFDLPQTCTTEM